MNEETAKMDTPNTMDRLFDEIGKEINRLETQLKPILATETAEEGKR